MAHMIDMTNGRPSFAYDPTEGEAWQTFLRRFKISALIAQWRADARVYRESAERMEMEASIKRLYGYKEAAQSQEELAYRCAGYSSALQACADQLAEKLR
ncbi:MAG: hypothetical protein ACP5P4_08100 [Steroidobacteraceae bacterium]